MQVASFVCAKQLQLKGNQKWKRVEKSNAGNKFFHNPCKDVTLDLGPNFKIVFDDVYILRPNRETSRNLSRKTNCYRKCWWMSLIRPNVGCNSAQNAYSEFSGRDVSNIRKLFQFLQKSGNKSLDRVLNSRNVGSVKFSTPFEQHPQWTNF